MPDLDGSIGEEDVRRFVELLERADRPSAIAMARDLLRSGVPVDRLLEDLVCPAQVEVGARWQSDEWDIGREHAATSVSEAVIAALATEMGVSGDRGRIVVACVDGEWHSLPARVLSEILRIRGWDVTFLGAATPTPHLIRYLNDEGPDALAISCSVPFNLVGARSVIEAARQSGIPVLAGGRAFGTTAHRADVLGASAWCASAAEAPDVIIDWPIVVEPAPPLTHSGAQEVAAMTRQAEATVVAARKEMGDTADGDTADSNTAEDLHLIMRFLSAALLTDDLTVLTDYLTWLDSMAPHREAMAVDEAVAALRDALPASLPAAHDLLDRALSERSTAALGPSGRSIAGSQRSD